jgi:MFS family permease
MEHSGSAEQPPKHPRFFYGWLIVVVAFLGDFMAVGMGPAALGVFLRPMKEDLGWSFAQLSTAVAVQGVLTMIVGPIVGPLLDRIGAKPIMVWGAVVAGTGLMALGFVRELWQFYVLWAITGALGLHEAGHLVTSVAVSKWFVHKLARALAIASMGVPAGAVVMAPVASLLIAWLGWRAAWPAMGAILLIVLLPPILLWMRRTPEDMGLLPDGEPQAGAAEARGAGHGGTRAAGSPAWTLKAALGTSALWVLILCSNLGGLCRSTVNIHLINYLQDDGLSARVASLVFSLNYIGSICSRVVYALLLARLPPQFCLALNLSSQTLGLLALMLVPFPLGVVVFTLTNGLLGGGFGFVSSFTWARYYGRQFQGSIRGITALFSVSSLGGPVFAAAVRDATGSYRGAFLAIIGIGLLAAFFITSAKAPVMKTPAAEAQPAGK